MARPDTYELEQVAEQTAQAINEAIDELAQMLAPPGRRPLFTEQMSQRKAYEWWKKNWSRSAGKIAREGVSQERQMALQLWMSQMAADEQGEGFDG